MLLRHAKFFCFLFFLLLILFLLFKSLGVATLTGDEAMSANLSWNVLKFGFPRAWDGRNIITNYNNGAEFTKNFVWIFHPWVSFYVGAASLLIAGKSAFGARFLYAVFGLLTLWLLHKMVYRVSKDESLAGVALLVASFSVPLLLLFRQSHYYVLVMFFSVATLFCYFKVLLKPKLSNYLLYVLSLLLVFYANYIYVIPLGGGIAIHYLIFFLKKRSKFDHLMFWGANGLAAGLAWPWVSFAILPIVRGTRGGVVGGFNHGWYGFLSNIFSLLWKLHTFTFPFITLALVLAVLYLFDVRLTKKGLRAGGEPASLNLHWVFLLSVIVGINILLSSILWKHPWLPYRYALLVILPGTILCAFLLNLILKRHRLVGIICVLLVVFTNWFHIFPYGVLNYLKLPPAALSLVVKSPYMFWLEEDNLYGYLTYFNRPGSYFMEYLMDIMMPSRYRTAAVVEYLRKNAQRDDVFIEEGVESEIIVFYTGLRAANKLIPEEKGVLKINSYFNLSQENAGLFSHLTDYSPQQIRWIISGNYYFPSEFRLKYEAEYEPILLYGQDSYMNAMHDIDTWQKLHAWEERPALFYIYKRKGT